MDRDAKLLKEAEEYVKEGFCSVSHNDVRVVIRKLIQMVYELRERRAETIAMCEELRTRKK